MVMLALYALAALTVGWSCKLTNAQEAEAAYGTMLQKVVAQADLPDGISLDYCHGAGDDGKASFMAAMCDICTITAAPGLDAAAPEVTYAAAVVPVVFTVALELEPLAIAPVEARSRGPPAHSLTV
jgi:hypothetical protein